MPSPARTAQPSVSDADRDRIEAAIAAGLLLIWRGSARDALNRLGKIEQPIAISAGQQADIAVFAKERAQLVQDEVNRRLAAAALIDDPAIPDPIARERQSMKDYNANTLIPYLERWALYGGLINTYLETPDPNNPAQSAADATLWIWQQNTQNVDDCTQAAEASPAPLQDLLDIGGDIPSHENCQCDLFPA